MDGKYPDPWNNLAVSYSISGQLDLAISAMRESIKIQPYYPEGYNNLASFMMQKKEYDKAEKMLDVALRLRSTYGKEKRQAKRLLMQEITVQGQKKRDRLPLYTAIFKVQP